MGAEALRVYEAAMQLPDDERADLVAALANSVTHGAAEDLVLASWVDEVKRRIEAHREGRSTSTPFEQVDAELDELFRASEGTKI